MLKEWLAHPLTRGLPLDDPSTTHLRRRIIREKRFLHRIYEEWYLALVAALPASPGAVVELGAGAGFLNELLPGLIPSEAFFCPNLRAVVDGFHLPFLDGSLRGIVMTNVLHHLPKPRSFLAEATRCVRAGGVLAMVEPWVTPWSRFVYTRIHHEPFDAEAPSWEFAAGGPLSGANGALPWIILVRDRSTFAREFPEWRIERIRPIMPFRYLVSGGVSLRSLVPGWSFDFWRWIEDACPRRDRLAMFAEIVLKRSAPDDADRAGRIRSGGRTSSEVEEGERRMGPLVPSAGDSQ